MCEAEAGGNDKNVAGYSCSHVDWSAAGVQASHALNVAVSCQSQKWDTCRSLRGKCALAMSCSSSHACMPTGIQEKQVLLSTGIRLCFASLVPHPSSFSHAGARFCMMFCMMFCMIFCMMFCMMFCMVCSTWLSGTCAAKGPALPVPKMLRPYFSSVFFGSPLHRFLMTCPASAWVCFRAQDLDAHDAFFVPLVRTSFHLDCGPSPPGALNHLGVVGVVAAAACRRRMNACRCLCNLSCISFCLQMGCLLPDKIGTPQQHSVICVCVWKCCGR